MHLWRPLSEMAMQTLHFLPEEKPEIVRLAERASCGPRPTVKVILAQTSSNPADSAIEAVVDVFPRIIVPQLALGTKVAGNAALTGRVDAILRRWLRGTAMHAKHGPREVPLERIGVRSRQICCCARQCKPDNRVIRNFVVTEPAREPLSATMCLELGTSLVVLATKDSVFFVLVNSNKEPQRSTTELALLAAHMERLLAVFIRDDGVINCIAFLQNVGYVLGMLAFALAVVARRHEFLNRLG